MISEEILTLPGKRSVGILSTPENTGADEKYPMVVLLNAGIVNRVGPNRLYVNICRSLAENSYHTFRFDFESIYSSTEIINESLLNEKHIEETLQYMDMLENVRGAKEFILIGICSGADVAFSVAGNDNRVKGLFLINGYYLDSESLKPIYPVLVQNSNLRYYKKNWIDKERWLKIIKGKSNILKNLKRMLLNKKSKNPSAVQLRQDDFLQAMELLSARKVKVNMIYSEGSLSYELYRSFLKSNLEKDNYDLLKIEYFPDTDHTFTPLRSQEKLLRYIQIEMNNISGSNQQSKIGIRLPD